MPNCTNCGLERQYIIQKRTLNKPAQIMPSAIIDCPQRPSFETVPLLTRTSATGRSEALPMSPLPRQNRCPFTYC